MRAVKAFLLKMLACAPLCAAFAAEMPVAVAKWPGNAACAVSYTFDDGLRDQYELAFPVLKACGLRGTFFLVGSKIGDPAGFRSKAERHTPTMTWAQVREMAAAGQEISSHGLNHLSTDRLDNDAIVREVIENKRLIAEQTGVSPLTFAYPYNKKTNKANEDIVALVEAQGLVGSRRFQVSLGNGRADKAKALIERQKRAGGWVVFMTHGIARGYDCFADPEELYAHWRWVAQQHDVWVAPLRDVCVYEKLREACRLNIETQPDGTCRVTPTVEGLDKNIFNQKLTLVSAQGEVLCAFDPFGGAFTVELKTKTKGQS